VYLGALAGSLGCFFARDVAAAGSCQGRLSCRLVLQRLGLRRRRRPKNRQLSARLEGNEGSTKPRY